MTLYELTAEWLAFQEELRNPDFDEESFEGYKKLIECDIEQKAEGYAKVKAQLEADIAGVDKEIKRLQAFKKSLSSNVDRLVSDLTNSMNAIGKTKFNTELFSFNIKKNPPALKLREGITVDDIPAEFVKWGDPEINKSAVKDAIKKGNEYEWAWLEQGESLQIK